MNPIVLTVLAVTGLLALVSLMLPVAERLRVPQAVLLAAAGTGLGVLGLLLRGDGASSDVTTVFAGLGMTAEAFLYIFLPVLLFEAALAIDVRRLAEDMAPVLLLAIVAVVLCTLAVGFALWLASGVPLLACLIVGAILATTDPVAVVNVFRDIGAPRRLSVLVEGESLFNDAAAIALFSLLVAMLVGERTAGPLSALLGFLRVFIGGLVFGFVLGRLACAVLPVLRELRLAEMTLTVALAYLAFIAAEHVGHVSGIVAAVTAGLVVSYEGRRRLSPTSWRALLRAWELLGFWASSLIFLFASMLVPRLLAGTSWRELLLLVVVILAAFAARALTLFGLMPLLSMAGLAERIDRDYKLVILWGGMRGAVSLALALAATENMALSAELRQFVAVLVTGFVLFTLFVNAPTLRPLIRTLGLDRLPPSERALRDRVLALARAEISADIGAIAAERRIDPAIAESVVEAYVGAESPLTPLARADERLKIGLAILAEREHTLYREHFEDRAISRRVIATLLAQAEALRDGVKSGGIDGYREAAAATLDYPLGFRIALWLQRRLGRHRPLAQQLADRIEALLAARLVLQDLLRFNKMSIGKLFGADTKGMLKDVLKGRCIEVETAMEALQLQYPNYTRALQAQILTVTALRLEDREHRRFLEEGIITPEVFQHVQRELRLRRRAAEARPLLDLGLDRTDLIARVPLFSSLDPERRRQIARLLRARIAVPGETIVRRGERGDAMFFISSGAVEVRIEPPVRLGTGDFFGELALLTRAPRNADVIALGWCQLLALSSRDLRRLLRADPALRAHIYEIARARQRAASG